MRFVDANYVEYTPKHWLSFNDVSLMPNMSQLKSRNDPRIDLTTPFVGEINLKIPIISANMDLVTESKMAIAMSKLGGYGILHRFYESAYGSKGWEIFQQHIEELVQNKITPAISIGLNPNDQHIIDYVLTKAPQVIVCLDIAHAHQEQVYNFLRKLRLAYPNDKVYIVAGNVCTPMGAMMLVQAGVNAIRVGIGCGSMCSTRLVTGHGTPQLTSIMNIRKALFGLESNVSLIADGGIRYSGDIIKALAAGADSVMIGRLFAGTTETPGVFYDETFKEVEYNPLITNLYKKYRGQSSKEFNEALGKTNVAAEGVSSYVPHKGSVVDVVNELVGGIKSGMTYSGVSNLEQLYNQATFVELTEHGYTEGTPHGLSV